MILISKSLILLNGDTVIGSGIYLLPRPKEKEAESKRYERRRAALGKLNLVSNRNNLSNVFSSVIALVTEVFYF